MSRRFGSHLVSVRKHRAKKLSGLKPTFPGWRWMVSLSGLFLPGLSPNLEPSQFPGLTEELLPSPPQLPSPSPLPLFFSSPLTSQSSVPSCSLPSPFPSPSLSSPFSSPLLPPPFSLPLIPLTSLMPCLSSSSSPPWRL